MAGKNSPLGYDDTPYLPDSQWRVHDIARPRPAIVTPGTASTQDVPGAPPCDAVVLFDPSRPVPPGMIDAARRYVTRGGRLLAIARPDSAGAASNDLSSGVVERDRHINALLEPFGLSIDTDRIVGAGVVKGPEGFPEIPVRHAHAVRGGEVLARVNGAPVMAEARHGSGSVVVVGFGERFADARMGVTGDVVPNPDLRRVFDYQFMLLRMLMRASDTPPD